jgi:hypothetical protein
MVGHILYNRHKGGKEMSEIKKFERLERSVSITVKTKCPEKWMLLDRETGEIYVGTQVGTWDRLEPVVRDS